MAAGEYVSVRSQREMFEYQIGLERDELQEYPEAEAQELALIYAAKGLPPAEATTAAARAALPQLAIASSVASSCGRSVTYRISSLPRRIALGPSDATSFESEQPPAGGALGNVPVTATYQGSGTYLSLPNAQVLQFYFEVSLKLGFLSLEQIQKALEMIGMEMAMTAAIDASRDELDQLDQILIKMSDADSIDAFAQCQLDFHLGLARASHNPVVSLIIDGLTSVIRAVMTNRVRMISVVKGSFGRSVASHRTVVPALRALTPPTT